MPQYFYSARDKNGSMVTGNFDANNEEEVIARLQHRGLFVVSVRAFTAASGRTVIKNTALTRKMHSRVKIDDHVMLCQQLATLVEAGVPLLRSLEVVSSQVESRKLLAALDVARRDVEAGSTFSEALARHPKVFNNLWVNLVQTGEASGHLAETLEQLSKHFEAAQHLRNEARTAMTYPLFLIVAATGVIALFVYWLIPKFTGMFTAMDVELPAITRFVIALSDFARKYVVLIVLGAVGFVFLLTKYLSTESGKWARDRLLLNLPGFQILFTFIQLAEFSRGLSTMLDSGVPLLSALGILEKSASNKLYGEAIGQVREAVKEGKPMAEPLNMTGMFPPITVQMVQVGEEVGELAGVVARLAKYYEGQVDIYITRMTRLFEPIAIVVMAGIVLVIVLAIFMPIFKMATGVKGG